jgi:hypothetical protein
MAAVLCLMFLPLMFGTFFMLGAVGTSLAGLMALATFILLGSGLVFGTMRLSTGWENE